MYKKIVGNKIICYINIFPSIFINIGNGYSMRITFCL